MLTLVPTAPYTPSPAEESLEAAILEGYATRHASAGHSEKFIRRELNEWRLFRAFTGLSPWLWERAHMDRYGAELARRCHAGTLRNKQGAVRRILEYARDPAYEWDERCHAVTGRHIRQICVPENTLVHCARAATSKRRQLTVAELDRLFHAIRRHIASLAARHRSTAAAGMHYALLCTALAFGLRECEQRHADLADLVPARLPAIRAFSRYQSLTVRHGKARPGGEPRRRVVYALRLFRDHLAVLAWYLREVRPQLARPTSSDAIFLSSRGTRMRCDTISLIFRKYRDKARLSRDLTHHCLRHTFETVLHESGLDLGTIMLLMGHASEESTLIYDHLGPEYLRRRALAHNRALLAEVDRRGGDRGRQS